MNENIITTEQVVEATEGVTAVAESVNWGKAGKIAGIAAAVVTVGALIGKGIEYFTNKKKQNAEASEEDSQVEEVDSVESDEE